MLFRNQWLGAVETRLEFKLEDFWVGIFWRWQEHRLHQPDALDVWVCLVPCLPLHITWYDL